MSISGPWVLAVLPDRIRTNFDHTVTQWTQSWIATDSILSASEVTRASLSLSLHVHHGDTGASLRNHDVKLWCWSAHTEPKRPAPALQYQMHKLLCWAWSEGAWPLAAPEASALNSSNSPTEVTVMRPKDKLSLTYWSQDYPFLSIY